jgi:hypothetical protein
VVSISYDRMGRAFREEMLTLSPMSLTNNLEYVPLHYRDTLGITFSNIQTFADELWFNTDDQNANGNVWNSDYTALSFPELIFPQSAQRKLAERRYDYPLDSAVSYGSVPNPAKTGASQSIAHPNLPAHQNRTTGRLVAESAFDTQGQPVEISVFSYTSKGQS